MSKLLIINLTRLTQQIDVRHADNKLDRIQIVARGRTTTREGMTVDARWQQKNPNVVQVVPIAEPVLASVPTPKEAA